MTGPRILTLDIETAPALVWTFSLFKPYLTIDHVEEPDRVICFAAKWRDEERMQFFSEWQHGHDGMVEAAFDLLDEADIVVTYNGDGFDFPHLNREFDLAQLGWPSGYHSADLYKVGKKKERYLSHKLDYITQQLGLGHKLHHEGFQMWLDVMAGDPLAQAKMQGYNEQDVRITEELFDDWLPLIDSMPAFALYTDDDDGTPTCPKCGSDHVQRRGYAMTKLRKYPRYHCQSCGAWSKGQRSVKGVDLR